MKQMQQVGKPENNRQTRQRVSCPNGTVRRAVQAGYKTGIPKNVQNHVNHCPNCIKKHQLEQEQL